MLMPVGTILARELVLVSLYETTMAMSLSLSENFCRDDKVQKRLR
jgi:hypothetical protein